MKRFIVAFAVLGIMFVLLVLDARAATPRVNVRFEERADWRNVCDRTKAVRLNRDGCVIVSPAGCVVITNPKAKPDVVAEALDRCAKRTAP